MGHGTGIMGKLLRAEGYSNIDGADASENFVKVANQTGWYRKCHQRLFGLGEDHLDQNLKGTYDLVVAVGVFGGGHIPKEGYDDAYAMLKPGGHFVACIRKKYHDPSNAEEGFYDKIQELI